MSKERLRILVAEYRQAEKNLHDLEKEHTRLQARFEIFEDLRKELQGELDRAQQKSDTPMAEYWLDLMQNYLATDTERPVSKALDEARQALGANEKRILYYEKKIKIIKRILGARLVQLLDSYDEKRILMGAGHTEPVHDEDDDERQRKAQEDAKKGFTFDRM